MVSWLVSSLAPQSQCVSLLIDPSQSLAPGAQGPPDLVGGCMTAESEG